MLRVDDFADVDTESSESVDEAYTIVRDGFEQAGPSGVIGEDETRLLATIAYPDVNFDDAEQRRKEQIHIMTNELGLSSFCSQGLPDARMLGVTGKIALAMQVTEDLSLLYDDDERIADADMESRMYMQRLKRVTKQIQCNMIIQECQSRIRMAVGDIAHLHAIIEKTRKIRETLPKPETIEEIAETDQAKSDAESLLGTPWPHHKESSRPVWSLHTLTYCPVNDNGCTFPDSYLSLQYKPKSASKKHKAFQATTRDRTSCLLRIAQIEREDCPRWQRGGIRCRGNAVCHAIDDEDAVVVVEQRISSTDCWDTRITMYKSCLLGIKKIQSTVIGTPVSVRDSRHLLGRALHVSTSVTSSSGVKGTYIVVVYARRILLLHRKNPRVDSRVFVADSIMCSAAVHVDRSNMLLVGTTTGSIYYVDVTTGIALGYIDFPLAIPVRGICMQGPNILAWNVRSIYRFHENTDVSPYELHVGQPCGVTGRGSLICTLSHTGMLWISETMSSSGFSRQLIAPKQIATEQKWGTDKTYWKLDDVVTYNYNAVWMGRTAVHVLYPCGLVRKLLFKVK